MLVAGGAARAQPPRPKLIVAISVDQFALDLFDTYRSTFTGGLKRLSEGRVFTGYQSHGATETCPGHSTILTGDHPARTGIVANNWYRRENGSNFYCVSSLEDPGDPLAKSSAVLKVDTLGDWMRAADPAARSVSVSGKDRAAIMMAGHHPTAVYWWDDGIGFNTSKYAGPAEAPTLATAREFDQQVFAAWRQAAPVLWPETISDRCAALQKPYTFGKTALSGRVPPESAAGLETGPDWVHGADFSAELRASPYLDRLTERMAERVIDTWRLGRGPAADILAVSFSATDYVGHRFGSGGAEMCAQMSMLDRTLGALLTKLDGLAVPSLVVLTADHGSVDAAERRGPPARRIDVAAVVGALSKHLQAKFDIPYDPLVGDDPRQPIVNLAPVENRRRAEIVADAVAWLNARPDVAHAFSADEIAAAAPPPGKPAAELSLAERFAESFDRKRSGDVVVAYPEFASLGVPQGPSATIAGHGSPWDYDRRVPILFWWPGVTHVDAPNAIETIDIAPTLAAAIGLTPPPIDGRAVSLGR